MKTVYRRTHLVHADRFENDAEHSFHIAAMACILHEYAPEGVDMSRVLQMLLFHDVVEIEAGDTFAYDTEGNKTKRARETRAADKLYALLPEDQESGFRALWEEFEAQKTPESHFALAMDRMEPILLNSLQEGGTWVSGEITYDEVLRRIEPIRHFPALYEVTREKVDDYFKRRGE